MQNSSNVHFSIVLSVSIVCAALDKSKHYVFMYHIVIDLVRHQSFSQFEKSRSSIEAFDSFPILIESQKHTHIASGWKKLHIFSLNNCDSSARLRAQTRSYSSDLVVISGDIYSP